MATTFPAEFGFHVPTRIVFGEGSLGRLPEVIDEVCGGPGVSVFLVTGKHSLKAQGTLDRVLGALGRFRITHFDGAVPFRRPRTWIGPWRPAAERAPTSS